MANDAVALTVNPDYPGRNLYERLGFANKYVEMRLNRKKNGKSDIFYEEIFE
jgi:ribosomal-protein-alanine N-acetyltransferase